MRAPVSWLRERAAFADDLDGRGLAEVLIRAGLEVETVDAVGADIDGPLVVGRVLHFVEEPQKNGKTIRWCHVDVGRHNAPIGFRGVVCGARNFAVGDFVVVALPGTTLPGGFVIGARKTYGHLSDGMICSERELDLGDDHGGILILPATDDAGVPLVPGQDAAPVLHLRDDVLDIAVTPDMSYCLSIRGLAREAAQALSVAFTDPVDRPTPAASAAGYPVVLESDACPLFVAVSVHGVEASRPTPRWMSRRLQLAGMRSISLAVDITNYVMLETGQPLHAYDAQRLAGPIVVRNAKPGEILLTLDGVTRQLDAADLLITDDSGPIGLAGVMGGESTELNADTVRIVIEAAHFDAATIGRTSRRHKLGSEASRRFERGVDPDAAYAAAHRVADLLVELAGGTIVAAETIAGGVPIQPEQTIDADLPQRILGTPVSAERVVQILRSSGVSVETSGAELRLVPPSWRPDLRDPYDYVEEVGQKVGLDAIEPVVPRAPVGRGLTRAQRARRAVTSAAADAGFVEVLTFPFLGAADLDALGLSADDDRRATVTLANPLADTQPLMRTTLLPGLFGAVGRNASRGNDDLALFEVGSVFVATSDVPAPMPSVLERPTSAELEAFALALPSQSKHLAAIVTGNWRRVGWQGPADPAGWTQVLALADALAGAVGARLTRTAADRAPWHPGRCAELGVAGTTIGYAGELHPQVCRTVGLPVRTAAVELDLDALFAVAPGPGSIRLLSPWPVAKEDVALIVDADVPAAALRDALAQGAGELLESIALFDVYTGPQVGAGKKSLAFALRFRAVDRTLTDAEAAAARDAAVAVAVARFGAVQRA